MSRADLDEVVDAILSTADDRADVRMQEYAEAAWEIVSPAGRPATPSLLEQPGLVVAYLRDVAGFEEAIIDSTRDDGLITNLRDLADLVADAAKRPTVPQEEEAPLEEG